MFSGMDSAMSVSTSEANTLAQACPDGGVILELGCHVGRGTRRIVQALNGRGTVLAIDNNSEVAKQARARCPEATVLVADSRTFTPDVVPDVVLVDDDIAGRVERGVRFKALGAAVFIHDRYGVGAGMVRI
jgi:hypothetical protein